MSRAERRGHRGSEVGSVLTADNPMWGLNSRTVRSWPEPKSRVRRLTDWATQVRPFKIFLLYFILFYFLFYFISYFMRDRGSEWENLAECRFQAHCSAQRGTRSHDPGIVTWAEIKSPTFNRPSHQGVQWEGLNDEVDVPDKAAPTQKQLPLPLLCCVCSCIKHLSRPWEARWVSRGNRTSPWKLRPVYLQLPSATCSPVTECVLG